MSTEERFTDADVELVARALDHKIVAAHTSSGSTWACHDCGERSELKPTWTSEQTWEEATGPYRRHNARATLRALADAGRLLPPGGETREEWKVTGLPGEGYPPYEFHWHNDEAGMREWIAPILERRDWQEGPTALVRTVTEYPDGSRYVGAWRPLTPED